MKAQKFSEEIVRVLHLPESNQLLGMNRDGLVTLLNIEDGSILYPHLFGIIFREFNNHFFSILKIKMVFLFLLKHQLAK